MRLRRVDDPSSTQPGADVAAMVPDGLVVTARTNVRIERADDPYEAQISETTITSIGASRYTSRRHLYRRENAHRGAWSSKWSVVIAAARKGEESSHGGQ